MATQTRTARQLGMPPSSIDGLQSDADRAIRAKNMAAVAQANPAVGSYLAANPRDAVAASDDHKSLGILGQAWDWIHSTPPQSTSPGIANPISIMGDWLGRALGYAPGDLGHAAEQNMAQGLSTMVRGVGRLADMAVNGINSIPSLPGARVRPGVAPGSIVSDAFAPLVSGLSKVAAQEGAAQQQHGLLSQGVGMVAGVAPFVVAGEAAPAAMGATGAGQSDEEAAKLGKQGTPEANRAVLANAIYQATIGHVFGFLGGKIAPVVGDAVSGAVSRSIARTAGGTVAGSNLGQAASAVAGSLGSVTAKAVTAAGLGTAMQAGSNLIAQQTFNPNQSIGQGTGESALSMVALDLLTHGLHSAIGSHESDIVPAQAQDALTKTGTELIPNIAAAIQGFSDASAIDAIGKASDQSKLRGRDPDAFANMMGHLANANGVDNVFVDPAAIRLYQQSDSYDHFNDPFTPYESHIHDAETVGGEVALPADFALGRLPATDAWKSVKDDIRLRSDSTTAREAHAITDGLAETAKTTFDGIAAAGQDKTSDAHAAIVDEVTRQAHEAGHTPRNARVIGELAGQMAATRAASTGRELQASDWNTKIVRVLPDTLQQARSADELDLAINAMRKGGEATQQKGKSLLEWINARGGINDSGGDLKAMGLDDWHKADPFAKTKAARAAAAKAVRGRNPLIREFDPSEAMGGVTGEGDYGHDTTLRAARDAGYFPELDHVDPSELDTNDLHSAIGEELAGRPRYSSDDAAKVDHVRAAGDDLRQWLSQNGRDPDGMSDAEIRKAVVEGDQSETDGRTFQQGEPVARIAGDEVAPKNATGPDLRKSAIAWYQEHLRGQRVKSDALGQDVEFASPKKMRAFSADEEKLRAIAALSDIIKHGELVESKPPYDAKGATSVRAYHTLRASIEIDGRAKSVEVTVREANNGHFYYDHVLPENTARNPESPGDKTGTGEPGRYEQPSDSGDDFNLHIQNPGKPRGSISFPVDGIEHGETTIRLFEKANLSTLIHEMGHQRLEQMMFDAGTEGATDQLKADADAVKKWFSDNGHPIGEDGKIPTEAHELFARGFERYMMEGKAPSAAVKRIFESIRGWLLNVYKTLAELRAPITPEIRQVFDRLIATDDEIAAHQKAMSLDPAITDPKAMGMTGPEYDAYVQQAQGARDQAQSELLAKTMATIRRQRTAEWNEQRNKVKGEEAARLDQGPVLKALRLMKDSPISREWVEDRLGQDAVDLLPRRPGAPVVREGGVSPDDIAEQAGFDSGRQMLETLIGMERQHREAKAGGDDRSMRARMIDQAADEEMHTRHGDDPLNDGSIEEEATAAVNNELAGKLLATELRYLGRKTGEEPTPYKIAREWARDRVRGGLIATEASASAIQNHARAVAKSGREAEHAMTAGDYDAAYAAKQKQMIASALLSEAKAAHDEVTKAQDALARVAKRKTMKSVDQDYLEQAHALLDDVQLGPRSQKSIERQGKWQAWADARTAEGYDIAVPASFEKTIEGTHWSRLSVEQFLGLKDAVDQVMHLGRLKQTLLDNKEDRAWSDIFSEARTSASFLNGPPPKDMADLHDPGFMDRVKNGVVGLDVALLRMETVFDWLDGGKSNGVFNRVAFKPIAEAQYRRDAMLKDYLGHVKDLIETVPNTDRARWFDREVMPWADTRTNRDMVLDRQQVIAMALNIGNEGNLQRLADGYRINAGAIEEHLRNTLTEGEWKFVQGVWDKIETLWPEISAMERRVNGIAPDKVEPREVSTPYGTMRGGYYPAVYDSSLNLRADENRGKESDLLDAKYTRATTRASATKDRSDQVTAPILLDLGVINRHLSEVIHDITHREAVMQSWRFLSHETVQKAVGEALGRQYPGMFKPWVKSVANAMAMDRAGNEGFGKFIRTLRQNTTMVGLGLRATTIMVHTSGIAAGTSIIGEKWMAHGLAAMARDPAGAVKHVLAESPEVRGHLEHFERDIGTMVDHLDQTRPTNRLAKVAHDGQKFALYGIGWMVQRTSVPVWIGAYNKALSEGLAHDDAKFAADKAVRYSLGASGAKDLTAIQRSGGRWGEAIKMLTMFYTSMASQYQRQRTLARDVMGVDQRIPRDPARLASRAFWGVAMVPVWDAVIRMAIGGTGPQSDEGWGAWAAKKFLANALGPIPIARELFEPVWNAAAGHGLHIPSITPLQGILDSVVKTGKDVGDLAHGRPHKTLTKDTLNAAGYLTGMVPGQMASAAQYLVDVGNGTAHPKGLGDWMKGLEAGHDPKR